jgi:DNA-binding NarL/FixJ family response regulator
MDNFKIIVADEYPIIRQGLRSIIEQQFDLNVVADVINGKELVEAASKLRPDVIITDEYLPDFDCNTIRELTRDTQNVKIVVLTDHKNVPHLHSLVVAGASDYLTKKARGDEVVHFIRSVILGTNPLLKNIPIFSDMKIAVNKSNSIAIITVNDLSERELAILKMIYRGKSNKEIGETLGINLSYIKAIISNIFTKMGASSRTDAISICLKAGILTLEDLDKLTE